MYSARGMKIYFGLFCSIHVFKSEFVLMVKGFVPYLQYLSFVKIEKENTCLSQMHCKVSLSNPVTNNLSGNMTL